MSAVCGILRFADALVPESDLERQLNALARRGPDRRRVWCSGGVGLGHALMRVTHEDAFDLQPLVDRTTGIALVADLRLDNRAALAEALGLDELGLSKLADSAVLMHAYNKWGEDCAEHLLGDFAFAIWDRKLGKLVLGRDHMGARYIYFHRGADCFVFATEKKALWAIADVPRRLDEFQLGRSIAIEFVKIEGASLFKDIGGVLPATVLVISKDGDMRSRRYWQPHADPVHLGRDEPYYVDAYRRILAEAVECRLRRNTQPAALMLSGGFDSAAVAALAGPVMSARGQKLIAVSSVMPSDYRGPILHARKWVEACARHLPHLDVQYVSARVGPLDNLEQEFLLTDNPTAPDRVAALSLFTAAAKLGARIMMDGHGGDYTLNPRVRGWLGRQLRRGRLRTVISELRAYWRNGDVPFSRVLKTELLLPALPGPFRRLWRRIRGASPQRARQILNPDIVKRVLAKAQSMEPVKRGGQYGMSSVLTLIQDCPEPALAALAAANGLEFTQPFHDKRVIELALAIPESLYVRGGRQRYLARKALADLYPPELVGRPDGNDSRSPDFLTVAGRAQPKLLAEIDRLQKNERLTRYFDFARMRVMITEPIDPKFAQLGEVRIRQAIRGILIARYIEWNERANL